MRIPNDGSWRELGGVLLCLAVMLASVLAVWGSILLALVLLTMDVAAGTRSMATTAISGLCVVVVLAFQLGRWLDPAVRAMDEWASRMLGADDG